jgi:hypothetical protein
VTGAEDLTLVLCALGLGDLLTRLPALRAIRRTVPGRIVLATSAPLQSLAVGTGVADAVIAVDGLEPLLVLRPDVAVNLHGSGPQSHRVLLGTQPRTVVAFASAPADVDGPAWRAEEHVVRRWCRLVEDGLGASADPDELALQVAPDPRFDGVVVVHPGAASPSRRWPSDRFAAVAADQRRAGRRVVVTGTAAERHIAEAVAESAGLPAVDVLAGRTDVPQLAATVAAADAVVSGDTGVAHLAVALGRPSVTLCGPVSPALWGPPPDRSRHVALWHGSTDVAGDPHGRTVDPALLRVTVPEVLSGLARVRHAADAVKVA